MTLDSGANYLALSRSINSAKETVRQREEHNHLLEEAHKKSRYGRERLYALLQVANKSLNKLKKEISTYKSKREQLEVELEKATQATEQLKKELRFYKESDINNFSNSIQRTLNKWATNYTDTPPSPPSSNLDTNNVSEAQVSQDKIKADSSSETAAGVKKQVSFIDRMKQLKKKSKPDLKKEKSELNNTNSSLEKQKSGILKNSRTTITDRYKINRKKSNDRDLQRLSSTRQLYVTKHTVSSLLKCRSKSPMSGQTCSPSTSRNISPVPDRKMKQKSPTASQQAVLTDKMNETLSKELQVTAKPKQKLQRPSQETIALNFQIPKNILASLIENTPTVIDDGNITIDSVKSSHSSPQQNFHIPNMQGDNEKQDSKIGMRAGKDLNFTATSLDCGEDRIEITLPQSLESQQTPQFEYTSESKLSLQLDSEGVEDNELNSLQPGHMNTDLQFGYKYSSVVDRILSKLSTL